MGRASSRKQYRRKHWRELAALHGDTPTALAQIDEDMAAGRYVPYTALLATGRSVRYLHLDNGQWQIEVQLAGAQGSDHGEHANRSFMVLFDSERSAKRTSQGLLDVLREWEYENKINTDVRYNTIIESWASAVKQKIEETNAAVLARAERVVHDARVPSLAELFSGRIINNSTSDGDRNGDQ